MKAAGKGTKPEVAEPCTRYEDGLRVIDESIYDHPKYYDLVFGTDVAAETNFILECAERFLDRPPKWFFEPACGTGRLLHSLLKRGHQAFGLDLNPRAVEFCNARLSRNGFTDAAIVADMCDFSRRDFASTVKLGRSTKPPASVAFNTINSFRHVESEARAVEHLKCLGDLVHSGGIYLLGIHLTPTKVPPSETESWSARRGHLSINTHMWTVARDRKKRLERFGIRFDIYTPRDQFRINDELRLRSYTPAQVQKLVAASGVWEIESTFDFSYDIDEPITVDASTEDVIYVLRRQS